MNDLKALCKGIVIFSIIGGAVVAAESFAQCSGSMEAMLCNDHTMTIYNQSYTPGWKVDFRIINNQGSVHPGTNSLSPRTNVPITYCGKHTASFNKYQVKGQVTVTDPTGESITKDFINQPTIGNPKACPDFKTDECTGAVALNKAPGGKNIGGDITIGPFSSFADARNKGQRCFSP